MRPATLLKSLAVAACLCAGLLPGANAQTVKIGVIAALTGGGAPWGLAAAEGVKIVASEINAQGGLDVGGTKQRVEVIAYDDQYKAADALAAYNRLVNQDGAKYVFILSSASALAGAAASIRSETRRRTSRRTVPQGRSTKTVRPSSRR